MRAHRRIRKLSRIIVALGLATLAISAYAASAATRPEQTDEQRLSQAVRRALVTIPWYGVFDNLEYQLSGSEVVLSGQVVQPVTKSDAEKAVEHIAGVTRVEDHITVLPLSRFDDRIRRAEYRSIFGETQLSKYSLGTVPSIHIIVSNGHVTLTGVVDNSMDYNIAKIRALSVPGVFSVTNNLRIG